MTIQDAFQIVPRRRRSKSMGRARRLLPLLVVLCAGCTAAGSGGKTAHKGWHAPRMPWQRAEEPAPQVPQRLVATWTDTTRNRQGEQPLRGFGGRLVFFGKDEQAQGVRVDGQLVVYAFDENNRASHDTAPTRRYVFPAEEFARHESDSQLGPSYSIWLPWDQVGGASHNISLIARFEPREGPIVLSEQTRHYLPGPDMPNAPDRAFVKKSEEATTVQTASFESGDASGSETASSASRATTIKLPPQLVERMAQRASSKQAN